MNTPTVQLPVARYPISDLPPSLPLMSPFGLPAAGSPASARSPVVRFLCMSSLPTPKICPVCGEDVPPRSLACPECGADHNSGWKEDSDGNLDLPGEEFDYDDFVKEEFGDAGNTSRIPLLWWGTAVVVLLALLFWFFGP